jgi:hypothetical protein
MKPLALEFPDFSGHPPPPKLSFEQYQRWVCEEIVPDLARCGKMTPAAILTDFMRNEGRQTEPWPDFGSCGVAAEPPR